MKDDSLSKPLTKSNLYNYRAAMSLSRKNLIINESSKSKPLSPEEILAKTKAEESALRDAIFNFFVNSLGTGCLSLPIILKYSGLVLGIFILILTSYLSYLSMNSVSLAASRKGLFDYSKLVKKLLGKVTSTQNAILFLDIIFVLYYFFIVMGYLLVCTQSTVGAFKYFNIDLSYNKQWLMILFSFIIVFPLSLFKPLLDHKFFLYFTMFSIIYICFGILLEVPDYVKENSLQDLKLYQVDWHLFTSFNFALFSYACQRRVTSVFAQMNNHSVSRMEKVNFRVCFFQMLFFVVVATIGYLALLDDTPLFIINRNPPKSSTESFNMFVARVLVALIMLYTMPGNVISVREAVKNLMLRQKRQTFSVFWNGYFNLLIVAVALILSYFYPETLTIFKFLGSFCAVYSFVFPALIDIVSSSEGLCYPKNLGKFLMAIGITFVAFMSSFLALYLSS